MRRLTAVLAVLVVAACDFPVGIGGAHRIRSSPFRHAFMEAAQCIGVDSSTASASFASVRWYHAPNLPGDTMGLFSHPNDIYLKHGRDAVPPVVAHESIHALTNSSAHPHALFGEFVPYDACETFWDPTYDPSR